jgi:lipopolysaccharide export system protein LptA
MQDPSSLRSIGMTSLVIFLAFSNPALAAPSSQPVEISAAKSLEWNRAEKTYTARENVVVVQGSTRIESDILTARYTEDKDAADIAELEAGGRVTIQSTPYTAYGDRAVYNVKTGIATLTGDTIKIVTGTETLTAQDKVEFSSRQNSLTAAGGVKMTRGADTVRADVMHAYFNKDSAGKMAAEKITASGHVSIQTEKETITGDEGTYHIPSQKAVLTGKVRVRQEENWLEGKRAEVDMATGISQLLGDGGAATEGRVKGVFYPKTKSP